MKKTKKSVSARIYTVLCLVLVVCFAATSCVRQDSRRNYDGEIGGHLVVWMDNDNWANAVIAAFTERYPNVTIRYEGVGNVDSRAKVSLDGPAGIGPDVFLLPHDHIANAMLDDILLPLPMEMMERYSELLLEASMKTCTFDGELFAIPIQTENIAFFYNKDLLGNTPVPQTFEEVIAFAERWNNPAANRFAMRWQVDDAYHNYFFLTAFGFQLFGPNMDDFRSPGFDTDAVRRGLEFHNSLRRFYNVNVADATWDSTVAAFQRGEVPFTISGPWAIADAVRNGINFGIKKLPTINGVQPRCFSGNIIAAVSSYSKNIPTALAFLDFLASVEGAEIQFQQTGKLAAFKDTSLIEGMRDDVYLRGIMEQAPYADPMPVIPEVTMMWEPLRELFLFTWDRQLSIPAAMLKAMETYDLTLRMAGKSR